MADFELAEEFLPVYEVSDAVATVADADRDMAGSARCRPSEVGARSAAGRDARRTAGAAGDRRPSAPRRAAGEAARVDAASGSPLDPDVRGRLDPARRTRWSCDRAGLVGKFWRPVIEWARITSADEFREFDEPGFAKAVYDLSVREVGSNRTLLPGLMRTATTDEHSRRWFRRYWTFGVGSGAHIFVGALLDSARRAADSDHTSNRERYGRPPLLRPALPPYRRPDVPPAQSEVPRSAVAGRGERRARLRRFQREAPGRICGGTAMSRRPWCSSVAAGGSLTIVR